MQFIWLNLLQHIAYCAACNSSAKRKVKGIFGHPANTLSGENFATCARRKSEKKFA